MTVSIREVARRAGVSPATVSRVLNAQPGVPIAAATRERVRHAVKELGYHPNSLGRALVRSKTDMVGLVLPPSMRSPLREPFFAALLEGVLTAANERGLDTIVFTSRRDDQDLYLAKLRDGRCDGLLVFYQPPPDNVVPNLLDAARPLVLIDDRRDDARLSCVEVENHESAATMTRHLLELGHRRIALLGFGEELHYSRQRVEGYRQALEVAGVAYDPSLVSLNQPSWLPGAIAQRVEELMALPTGERPTALFCLEDDIASGVMACLNRQGLRVPDDVSVAGFNDDGTAERQHPPLTTMRQPYEQIGVHAIDLLLDQISDIACRGRKVTLPTTLMVRGSTAPPPR